MAAEESYPADVRYHREHDWARIEDGEAVLGITWYAQDALGELVHYEPPETRAVLVRPVQAKPQIPHFTSPVRRYLRPFLRSSPVRLLFLMSCASARSLRPSPTMAGTGRSMTPSPSIWTLWTPL